MSEAPGTHDPTFLPPDIPVPQDDGGARHLPGMKLPDLALPATSGGAVNLARLAGRTVLYSIRAPACPASICRRAGTIFPARAAARRNPAAFATISPSSKRSACPTCSASRRRTPTISAKPPSACICRSRSFPMPGLQFTRALEAPDVHRCRHDAAQAHGACRRRRHRRESVLSGVSAGQERRRGRCVVARASLGSGYRCPQTEPRGNAKRKRQRDSHDKIRRRSAFPPAGMGRRGERVFRRRGSRLRIPRDHGFDKRQRPSARQQGRRLPDAGSRPRLQRQRRLPLDDERRRLERPRQALRRVLFGFAVRHLRAAGFAGADAGRSRRRADLGRLPVGQPLRDHPGARAISQARGRSSCRSTTDCCSAAWKC